MYTNKQTKEKTPLLSVTIKDCKVDTFRCPGNGGQKVNKTDSGVRITHAPSGAVAQSVESRSQRENKEIAFKRMAESKEFQLWLRMESMKRAGMPSIDQIVDDQMKESNLRIETKNNGKWE
jgi:protein subunit release factor A